MSKVSVAQLWALKMLPKLQQKLCSKHHCEIFIAQDTPVKRVLALTILRAEWQSQQRKPIYHTLPRHLWMDQWPPRRLQLLPTDVGSLRVRLEIWHMGDYSWWNRCNANSLTPFPVMLTGVTQLLSVKSRSGMYLLFSLSPTKSTNLSLLPQVNITIIPLFIEY